MFRRQFLKFTGLASAFLIGCVGRSSPSPTAVLQDPDGCTSEPPIEPAKVIPDSVELSVAMAVRQRIQEHLPNVTAFDPFTLIALVGFVCRIVQLCQMAAVLRQQAICQQRPNGKVWHRLETRLRQQYHADHPEANLDDVAMHTEAAMKAFAKATPGEIRDIKQRLDQANKHPTEIVLFDLVEDLSRIE